MLERLQNAGFDLATKNHAEAILNADFRDEVGELVDALIDLKIPAAELIASGGGEAASTQRLRRQLSDRGWKKHNFTVETKIDGETREAIGHEIDHVRAAAGGKIALEIEWNNKDPFFDRDLESFQRLHALSVVSVGVVVTRGRSLQDSLLPIILDFIRSNGISTEERLVEIGMKDRTVRQRDAVRRRMAKGLDFADAFAKPFVSDKYGMATTHWSKLEERLSRGVGNPCPLLLIGLPESVVS